jgi:excisionase family DNA binding protein
MTTADVAKLRDVTRRTVEREIQRGNLSAVLMGGTYVIEQAEAERWAAQFQPYAQQHKPRCPAP